MSEFTESRPSSETGAHIPASRGPDIAVVDRDEQRLHELGYAQELHRGMGWFSNFAVSFTIISILTGGITTYYLGMVAGGPRVIIWGWLFVGGMVMLVGAGMAEVCSSFPTAGGLYYWAAKLAPEGKAPVWSWFTGWFNLLGQVAVTASIDFGMATFLGFFLNLTTGFRGTPKSLFLIYTIVLVVHGILNTLGVNMVAKLNNISVWWHLTGVVVIVGALFILPDAHKHQTLSTVFTKYYNGIGWGFGGNAIWVALVGLMLAQYTLTGYDASAHMTEETRDAATSGPRGIMTSIWVSVVAGLVLMIGLTYAIPWAVGSDEYNAAAGAGINAAGVIWVASIGRHAAEFLILICLVAQFFCGMASVTANSRMIYAFSRDGAVPGSRSLAQGEQAHPHTNELHLVRRCRRVPPRPAVAVPEQGVLRRVLRDRVCCGRRPLHLLHHSRAATSAAWAELHSWSVAARQVEPDHRVARCRVGRPHLLPADAAAVPPRRRQHLELRARRGGGCHRFRRHLLAGLGAQVVQGPEGAGFGRGARSDRGGTLVARVVRNGPAVCATVGIPPAAHRSRLRRDSREMRMSDRSRREGLITVEELRTEVDAGTIDTVIIALPDMQGRLQGKRIDRPVLPRRGSRARHRGLQLPARRRRRDEHRRRLRDVVVGVRLRRLRHAARSSRRCAGSRGSPAPRC